MAAVAQPVSSGSGVVCGLPLDLESPAPKTGTESSEPDKEKVWVRRRPLGRRLCFRRLGLGCVCMRAVIVVIGR